MTQCLQNVVVSTDETAKLYFNSFQLMKYVHVIMIADKNTYFTYIGIHAYIRLLLI